MKRLTSKQIKKSNKTFDTAIKIYNDNTPNWSTTARSFDHAIATIKMIPMRAVRCDYIEYGQDKDISCKKPALKKLYFFRLFQGTKNKTGEDFDYQGKFCLRHFSKIVSREGYS